MIACEVNLYWYLLTGFESSSDIERRWLIGLLWRRRPRLHGYGYDDEVFSTVSRLATVYIVVWLYWFFDRTIISNFLKNIFFTNLKIFSLLIAYVWQKQTTLGNLIRPPIRNWSWRATSVAIRTDVVRNRFVTHRRWAPTTVWNTWRSRAKFRVATSYHQIVDQRCRIVRTFLEQQFLY